jgi:hypothetical protein
MTYRMDSPACGAATATCMVTPPQRRVEMSGAGEARGAANPQPGGHQMADPQVREGDCIWGGSR